MRRVLAFVLALAVVATGTAVAQTRATGTVVGRVIDADGQALPGVQVTVVGPALIGEQAAFSGADGQFRISLLPPGVYTLTFRLQGFATLVREEVEVGVQRNTSVTVEMTLASVEETITVTGKSPIVDIKSTKRSSEYSDELRNALPETRGVGGDLMSLAPEATPSSGSGTGSGSNFFGDNSNAFQVDGVNVSDPSGGSQFPFYSPDWFEVVELTAIGANAEYGKFQGSAFNVVTKSGGNSFHGESNFFYQDNNFIDDNTEKINEQFGEDFSPPTVDYRYDFTFGVGGPIQRDKTWFFASYQAFYESDSPALVPYSISENSDRFLGKITWQANQDNRVIGSVMADTYTLLGRPTSRFRTFDQTGKEPSMNITPNITWNSVLNPNAFLEVKYSGFYGYFDLVPFVNLPQFVEDTTGFVSGGLDGHFAADRSRTGVLASLSYFAEGWGGDHSFKFGAEYEHNVTDDAWAYNANIQTLDVMGDTFAPGTLGISYVTFLGEPYLAYIYQPNVSRDSSSINVGSVYGQDDWTIGDRLTLNLGLRMDYWTMGFTGGPGRDDLPTFTDVAPRIGANLDLLGDGRTSVNAFWGRFYDEARGTMIDNFDPQAATFFCLEWTGAGYDDWCRIDPLVDLAIDPELNNQFADQFVVGVDQQLTEDLALTVRYIRKDNKDIIGGQDIRTVFAPVEVTDLDGDTITLYNAVGGLDRFRVLVNNPWEELFGESFREYNGVQFKATKRMSDNWSLIGSLLIQKSEGITTSDTGSIGTGDDPNDFTGTPGELPDGRRYVTKVQGSYLLPNPIRANVGWIVNWLSGGRVHRTQRFTTFFDPATGETGRFGQRALTVPIEPIGSLTKENQFKLDLRVDKKFELPNHWGDLGVVLDIFNVFNDDTITNFRTRADLANFGTPTSLAPPRLYRLGLRWLF